MNLKSLPIVVDLLVYLILFGIFYWLMVRSTPKKNPNQKDDLDE